MNYVLVIISTVLLAVFFGFTKQFQMSQGTGAQVSLKYNSLLGLATAIIFLVISGFKIEFSVFSIIFATLMSICTTTYTLLGFQVLKEGNMAT